MVNTDELLAEKEKTHGDFGDHAGMAVNLKMKMHAGLRWKNLSAEQKEALDMIAHKIGRILAGNPNEPDHWDDIAGYARLVSQRLWVKENIEDQTYDSVPKSVKEPSAPTPGMFPQRYK